MTASPARPAAILFEPDGYQLDGPKLMGRQAAGNAFLRAAVMDAKGQPVVAVTPNRASAQVFVQMARAIDPAADPKWLPTGRLDLLSAIGTLYIPGPVLGPHADLRLRVGPEQYSLVGVTHTTASHAAMDAIAGLLVQPVMPWDALICTSRAVLDTAKTVLDAETRYLSWRLGSKIEAAVPELPVIPLGVHCDEFERRAGDRERARLELGIPAEQVVALFVGRLSYHGKAHPHAMYVALERVARETKRHLALIQCGWFANDSIERAFKEGARDFCASVALHFLDGKDAGKRRLAWAAADFFISMSDNVQETFGLAPVEAMAAGLPAVVSDWDGYRDTVRDGIDGFLIPTTMLPPGAGAAFAQSYEQGDVSYDRYCALVCRTISVDHGLLEQRIGELVRSEELRQRLGARGAERARAEFDWSVIYRRYRQLYAELGERRSKALQQGDVKARMARAPRSAAGRLDPFVAFRQYPSRVLGATTRVALGPDASLADYRRHASHPLFDYIPQALPKDEIVAAILGSLAAAGAGEGRASKSLGEVAAEAGAEVDTVLSAVSVLAKMGLLRTLS